MARLFGSPGTFSSLALRIIQVVFALTSCIFVIRIRRFHGFTGFRVLAGATMLQFVWSLAMAAYDVRCLIGRGPSSYYPLVTGIMVEDWLLGGAVLATTAASGGLLLLMGPETRYCSFDPVLCKRMLISVMLAFGAWLAMAISACVQFIVWVRATVARFEN